MNTIADRIAHWLVAQGVKHVFAVTGGGAMFLNQALGSHPGLHCTFLHHEQSCAMAAEGYARITGTPAVVMLTTGPGAINALNGVYGAYTDSIPMIVLSGQVKRSTCRDFYDLPVQALRQLGDQEGPTVAMATPVCKFARLVRSEQEIATLLPAAWAQATQGRPGPVWLDIPLDIQQSTSEIHIPPAPAPLPPAEPHADKIRQACRELIARLRQAHRPLILAGTGVRLAGCQQRLLALVERLGIPLATAWTHDLIASDHPLFAGRPGSIGTRAGNFCLQAADWLLVLGSRLNIRQTSYAWHSFAQNAWRAQVDIDAQELHKPTHQPHLGIAADLRHFLDVLEAEINASCPPDTLADGSSWEALNNSSSQAGCAILDAGLGANHSRSGATARICNAAMRQNSHISAARGIVQRFPWPSWQPWAQWCQHIGQRYSVSAEHRQRPGGPLNPYASVQRIFGQLRGDDIIVCGNASACILPFQMAHLQAGQRMFSNSGSASMGYDLPAALGAAMAAKGTRRVICFAGDGSLSMNLQELQSLKTAALPLIVIVLNNGGYQSIRQTHENYFGRVIGATPGSGVEFPDFCALARAFGLPAERIEHVEDLPRLDSVLQRSGPLLMDLHVDPQQGFAPRIQSRLNEQGQFSTPELDDMHPFLPDTEVQHVRQQAQMLRANAAP